MLPDTMSSARILRAITERGPLGAFEQFFKLRTFKFGRLVGVDALGNKYYENTEEYKHGVSLVPRRELVSAECMRVGAACPLCAPMPRLCGCGGESAHTHRGLTRRAALLRSLQACTGGSSRPGSARGSTAT